MYVCAPKGVRGSTMAGQITKQVTQVHADTQMVVCELVGEHAMQIIAFLRGKEKISEFIIAEELEMEINEVRNILYKLLEHNIVRFLRKKDRIKGWYICYWDFNPDMIPHLKTKILKGKLEKLQERLEQESSAQYYICSRACTRLPFDEAMEQNFKCAECGTILQEQDNTRTKEFLTERIAELEGMLAGKVQKARKAKA
jgi:transcription factor E